MPAQASLRVGLAKRLRDAAEEEVTEADDLAEIGRLRALLQQVGTPKASPVSTPPEQGSRSLQDTVEEGIISSAAPGAAAPSPTSALATQAVAGAGATAGAADPTAKPPTAVVPQTPQAPATPAAGAGASAAAAPTAGSSGGREGEVAVQENTASPASEQLSGAQENTASPASEQLSGAQEGGGAGADPRPPRRVTALLAPSREPSGPSAEDALCSSVVFPEKPRGAGRSGRAVFEPPAMRCGDFRLRFRMLERADGVEEVRAGFWRLAGGQQVSGLRGFYLFRSPGLAGGFQEACAGCGGGPGACARLLLDGAGRVRAPLNAVVSAKAHSYGLMFLEEVGVAPAHRGNDVGLDLASQLLQRLAGPMKRLTLVLCRLPQTSTGCSAGGRPSPPLASLQRHWARLGFRRATPDGDVWFLDLGVRQRCLSKEAVTDAHLRCPVTAPKSVQDTPQEVGPPAKKARSDLIGEALTPRMRYLLLASTRRGLAALEEVAGSLVAGKPGVEFWGCGAFPEQLRKRGVFKSFLRGMMDVLRVVEALLMGGALPTASAVASTVSPISTLPGKELGLSLNKHLISHFFGRGGRPEHAIQAVLDEGAALFSELQSAEGAADAAQFEQLPRHKMDGDFQALRDALMRECSR